MEAQAPRHDETSPIRVAIVEDNPEFHRELEHTLSSSPDIALVAMAESAGEALTEFTGHADSIDVVLLDIHLPDRPGCSIVRELKEKLPGAEIMMLTISGEYDLIYESLLAGASGYLLKTDTATELLPAIRDLHTGGSPMTNSIARKVIRAFRELAGSAKSSPTELLTDRERQILDHIARGRRAKDAANAIGISASTVHNHLRSIYRKLQVHNKREAAEKWREMRGDSA